MATRHPDLHRNAPDSMYIGGSWVGAVDGETFDVTSPATGELLAKLPAAGRADIDAAVAAARTAFEGGWGDTSPKERADLLFEFADLIEADIERITMIDAVDNGSTIRKMRGGVKLGLDMLRNYAGFIPTLTGRTIPLDSGSFNYTVREPYGVVGVIVPFNHPTQFVAQIVGSALGAGNTMIFKPSELTSLSALEIAAIAADLFPAGVLNMVTGAGGAGSAMTSHPGIDKIHFKGSLPTGRKVLEAGAATIKPISLEMGGKNPMVVFPDVSVDAAVKGAVDGMNFVHQGQSCGSCSRVYVHEDIYEEFRRKVVERVKKLRPGLPWDEDAEMGSIVSRPQYERVLSFIKSADEAGVTRLTGGEPFDAPEFADGLYLQPTIYENPAHDLPLVQEEIFGPVMCLFSWSDEDEVFRRANDTVYGLTASVWSNDLRTVHRAIRRFKAGLVWVNNHQRRPANTPFGGYKQSGLGKERFTDELNTYSQEKSVLMTLDADIGRDASVVLATDVAAPEVATEVAAGPE
jgi:betaine-aldehyde dehydrogenase